jgi:hypothetical protein
VAFFRPKSNKKLIYRLAKASLSIIFALPFSQEEPGRGFWGE